MRVVGEDGNDAPDSGYVDVTGTLQTLRNAGYAVVAFGPEDLKGINATLVEDKLALVGSDIIDYLVGHPQEQ